MFFRFGFWRSLESFKLKRTSDWPDVEPKLVWLWTSARLTICGQPANIIFFFFWESKNYVETNFAQKHSE